MGQEETTQLSRVRSACLDWTPVLTPWIFSSVSPQISPNKACTSTRNTQLCDDPDIDNIVTCLTSTFQRSVERPNQDGQPPKQPKRISGSSVS